MAAVSTDEKAQWIKPAVIDTEDVGRVVRFFVLNSPVDGLSSRQKSLRDYGWHTPWRKPYSLRKRLNALSSNNALIFSAQTYDTMDAALMKADLLSFPPSDINTERVCIYNGKGVQYLSLFAHIRNAIAHGRFNVIAVSEEQVFIMEDVAAKKRGMAEGQKTCSARMVLRMTTLQKWMDFIEGGETQITSS